MATLPRSTRSIGLDSSNLIYFMILPPFCLMIVFYLFVCFLLLACFILLCVLSCVFPYDVNIAFFSKLSKYFFVFSSFSVILYNFMGFILVKVDIVDMCVCVFLILAR